MSYYIASLSGMNVRITPYEVIFDGLILGGFVCTIPYGVKCSFTVFYRLHPITLEGELSSEGENSIVIQRSDTNRDVDDISFYVKEPVIYFYRV
jgi:hypothetical protein